MSDLTFQLKVLHQIGLLKPQLPLRLLGAGKELLKWGPGFPSGVGAAAARYPKQLAIVDDEGEITWRELRDEINRLTAALKVRGLGAGDSIALLCRNHRYMVMAMVAIMQLGGRILLLNTMASSSQLHDLTTREDAKLVILDEEFCKIADKVPAEKLMLAWTDTHENGNLPTVRDEVAGKSAASHPKPSRSGSIIIFTSGTTGLPKGARRTEPESIGPLLSFFGSVPYRGNSTVIMSAPLFHSWGLINFGFGLSTVPTYVMRRRFVPEQVLKDLETHRADALVVVPLMIQRLADVDPKTIEKTNVSSLRLTATSGSALAGELAIRFQDLYTDSIYNFYGATETGWVSVASPQQLRDAPGTAGSPPHKTHVKILDDEGKELPAGEQGVIYVYNEMMFGGYTDGQSKAFIDGLMNTGDIGYFDEAGRLFVVGRDDDMVISGGENVFPRELEDALIEHPHISDVVVTGIDDPSWGQCLAAYVVKRDGAELSADDVTAYAKERVARFAVPRRTMFIDELPRNPTGKVMKRELPPFE